MTANQKTLVVTGDSLSISLNSVDARKLKRFSKATGYPLSKTVDRGIELFLRQEAPVYRTHAKQGQQA
jgi:hypothetical protein